MQEDLAGIVFRLISSQGDKKSLTSFEAADQFDPGASDTTGAARSLNAGFLIALAGRRHPRAGQARRYLASMRADGEMGALACFLDDGLDLLEQELRLAIGRNPDLARRLRAAREGLERASTRKDEALGLIWEALFPEGLSGLDDRRTAVEELRRRRRVDISSPNPNPVTDPAREVLFTANALLTIPHPGVDFGALGLDPKSRERLNKAAESGQLHWYDHPIPLGIETDRNEVVYGLRGLASALAFERSRRPEWEGRRLSCVLSVSVTHQGLQGLAREYLSKAMNKAGGLEGLDIYLFTEGETRRLKDEIIFPAAGRYFPENQTAALDEIMGVDGEYGRHYSFLKAVAAWWQVLIDSRVKATFKIDLDQVFPQAELVDQTGASAFEHLTSPLWGAKGRDYRGREVELGLLAGTLVNQNDLDQGLFTPDVPWPNRAPIADELVFFSTLPQALSTEAEMMTRYHSGQPDGRTTCLQRVHVTGGTTGAMVESLRRHHPFTPTFIGRAEDQAYLLSVLYDQSPSLRYLHKDGLIMRHDKAALIPEAIETALVGKLVQDYARILWFSYYAQALPWPLKDIKEIIDPFTGCFVSGLPLCLVYLRLTLKAASLFAEGRPEAAAQALELLDLGCGRLGHAIRHLEQDQVLAKRYAREKQGWDLFYNVLDHLEKDLSRGRAFALEIQARARELLSDCRVF